MRLAVDSRFHLTELRADDAPALVHWLGEDPAIHEQTLSIPFPYTTADALAFLAGTIARDRLEGYTLGFAIRDAEVADELVGSIGLDAIAPGHRAQLGYWIARPLWGAGIMTRVVSRVCEHAFQDLDLIRVTAHVFTSNPGSCRVLEKAGFEREGLLRRHYRKRIDGREELRDAYAYARLKE